MLYWWTELGEVPEKAGVYAWYYSPEITDFDLEQINSELMVCRKTDDTNKASQIVEDFLHNNLFRYFQEEPYQASLRGPLKPRYEGYFEHTPELSEELVRRIVEEPERLFTIKNVLEKSAPYFASPIYIGMSENLSQRIKTHKKLIEKYCSSASISGDRSSKEDKGERDRSFAMRISKLSIPPTRLFVVIHPYENLGKRYVDIENILNRIHYPLLGRN